jgi:hypothetical protein
MAHIHECPRCGATWECGEANYQDECPYPTSKLCLKCWARTPPKHHFPLPAELHPVHTHDSR